MYFATSVRAAVKGRAGSAAERSVYSALWMSLAQAAWLQLPRPVTAVGRSGMCCKGGLVKFGWQGPPELHGHRTVLETAVLLLHQAPLEAFERRT